MVYGTCPDAAISSEGSDGHDAQNLHGPHSYEPVFVHRYFLLPHVKFQGNKKADYREINQLRIA